MSDGKVFLVDDDDSVLRALERLLRAANFEVSAFQSPENFLLHHDIKTPGCAVFDVVLGEHSGLDLLRALVRTGHMRPTIFITGKGDIPMSVQAMKSGAIDFLTKPVQETELIDAVQRGIERDREEREERAKLSAIGNRLASLTPKEGEVLTRIVTGRLNKQIAADLGISEKTVKVHRGRVMSKMCVRSLADLVRTVDPALFRLLHRSSPSRDPE